MGREKSTPAADDPFFGGFPSRVGQFQPRCHLPIKAVRYPFDFSMSPMVRRPFSMRGGSQGQSTLFFSRVLQAYRPVRMA